MRQGMKQQGVFVTGTDTDVGKTWVGQMIIRQLCAANVNVIPRKPVESGWQTDVMKSDAWLLGSAASVTGKTEALDRICPNRFQAAISPVRAATLEGKVLLTKQLKQQCIDGIDQNDFLYVEGAGGFFSPLASDGLNADLAKQLGLPVLLVADDKLGCINHILLSLAAIEGYGLSIKGVILNTRKEVDVETQMNNFDDLQSLIGTPVFQVAYQQESISEELLRKLIND
ncbi:MAG: dethiobiotin synthase [Thiotrichaceae bacterium]